MRSRRGRSSPRPPRSPPASAATPPAWASVLVGGGAEPVAVELWEEAERLHRPHAVEVDLAVEVIALVLHDAGVEGVGDEAERTPVPPVGLDLHPGPARH